MLGPINGIDSEEKKTVFWRSFQTVKYQDTVNNHGSMELAYLIASC